MSDIPQPPAAAGRLRLSQVRAIFRLVGEVREMGADPDVWRPHMVRSLRELLDAQFVVSSEIHFRRPSRVGPLRVTDIGWISDTEGAVCKAHHVREVENFDDFWVTPAQGADAAGRSSAPKGDNGAAGAAAGPDGLIPVKPTLNVHAGRSFILSQYALKHAGAVDQLGLHRLGRRAIHVRAPPAGSHAACRTGPTLAPRRAPQGERPVDGPAPATVPDAR